MALVPAGPRKTVEDELQQLCDVLLDDATGITWDLYRRNQRRHLEMKVRMALYQESVTVNEETGKTRIVQATDKESISRNILIQHVSDKIWDQRKHTGGDCLRMSIIYIALVKVDSSSPLNEKDFMIRPLFRTMKCLDRHTRSAEGKCMVFVDEFGWVYQSWRAFVQEMLYPDTQIVAPQGGVFKRWENTGLVRLFYFKAPKTAAEIEKEHNMNIAMTIGGLGSAAVLGAAAFFPVTAPFVWGAAIVGGVVGLVAGGNSVSQLCNRFKHEQSIGLGDKEARAHWLAVSGTLLGFMASGATSLLRGAATAGNVSKGFVYAANGLLGSSIIVNGMSIGNSIWAVSTDGRPVTAVDLLQLSASLFLFTHSVYNFQTAQRMVQETQAQHLSDYKQTLSKNGQKRFQNKLNQRNKAMGTAKGTGDTIRNLNTAEHYNNNFKGTGAYQTTSGFVENQKLTEKLTNSFVGHLPESISALVKIYTVVVKAVGEDYWELFKKMALLILQRLQNCEGLAIESVISDCFTLVKDFADRKQVKIEDVLMYFNGLTYESIPRFVREWFEMLIPKVGSQVCQECGGFQYSV